MKKFLNILPLFIIALVCISAFSWSALAFLEGNGTQGSSASLSDPGAAPLKSYLSIGQATISSGAQTSSGDGGSLAVSATPSEAVGRIFEQFISPYSAPLSYNGIYLKNSTGLDIDIKTELASKLDMKLTDTKEPQVLIVHTHATESYMLEDRDYYTAADKARNTDNSKNVTYIGEIFANVLKEGGIGVIHDKTQHDHPAYNGSYGRAAETINEYLKKYPSIKIVVDVHRDSIAMSGSDKCKPTATVNGKKAAQVMLVMGSETGSVTGFPNWRQNFRLALRYQQTMEVMYPGLARPLLFASRRYNENLTTGSMILEVGTDSNYFEEACYSAELAGKALLSLLNTLK